jgi:hypothetical protein
LFAEIAEKQMSEKGDEAKAWLAHNDIASAAVRFTNDFLGLRKSGADVKLEASDLARLVDIVRAISWVESKHGTGAGAKTKG